MIREFNCLLILQIITSIKNYFNKEDQVFFLLMKFIIIQIK